MSITGQSVNVSNADIPVYGVVAERNGLRDVLENIRNHRLTLVSAPPGYGKTTAIAQFALQSDLPTAWHSLHERERDLPALLWHSLQALEFIAPGISIAATQLNAPDESASYIASYLREHLTRHTIYVMDDLHYIAAAPHVERWLRELLRQLPQTCHLVLISRALPDLPLAELIARGDVLAIGQEQLKFTAEDASNLATKVGANLPEEDLKERVQHLEGWPVGVAMSLRPLPADLQIGLLRGSGGPEALFDALANGILKSLPPMLGDFLLSASTFARVTPEICSEVLGVPLSTGIMTDIVRRNLFVSQVSGGLLLHRLFRNFLQRRLQQADRNRYTRLHTKAADWYRQDNQDDEAFHHYMAADSIDEALNIVQRTHSAYYKQGNIETLLGWRAALGDYAARLPQFTFTCAMILTDRYLYNDAILELDSAEAGFMAEEDDAWVAEAGLQRAMIQIRRGDYRSSRVIVTPIAKDSSLKETTVGRAKHLLALIELATGDLNKAISLLEQIRPLFERTNDSFYVSAVLQDLAIAYARGGNMASASHCLQRLVGIRRTLGQSNALALALNNLGFHYHQIGEYDLALNTLEEGVQIIAQTTNNRAESYIRWSMGDLQRDLGNDDAALRLYESAYELSSGAEPLLQQSIALSMATLYRWRRDYPLAIWVIRDIVEDLRSGNVQDAGIGVLLRANDVILKLARENAVQSMAEFEEQLAQLSGQPVAAEYVQIAIFTASTALMCGEDDKAVIHLRKCVRACEQGVARNIIAAEILNTPQLLTFVGQKAEFGPLVAAADRLRKARIALSATPRIESPAASEQTYSLRVLALGDETIERDGGPVTTAEWRSSRAKEFFLYLLFEGAASREELSLVFWPESSSSRVRSNFHTTLYRARRALGENVILFENDLYRINPEVSVWCDALVFQRYIREAQVLAYSDVRADDLYHKASAFYRGDFLPDLDAEWIIPHREALYQLNIDALIGAGHCARARRDFDHAISLFKRALKIDPYREEAYRALFTCYAGMGELNYVLKQYNAMSTIFEAELGILPSPETHAYVQQLTQQIS
ncbi:MAG: tetratricopeptide repeat protein [Chloroflexi bacterium]|nr:tetratricopeptide repeat protein [Chloroflexota bacterium]